MYSEDYVLGIDTSNYKTSVCILNCNEIVCDRRVFLDVKDGEKGLRQSDAFFQHVRNLPGLIEDAFAEFEGSLSAIAFASRPRPLEGSYMPVFTAGESFARSLGAALDIPVFSFSHQEGHIQAIKSYTEMNEMDDFIACHFSGGTCEVLKIHARDIEYLPRVEDGYNVINGEGFFYDIDIIGGSRDISYGQVLDRAGVEMGFSFPAGKQMDRIAGAAGRTSSMLTPIKVEDAMVNLSGIDTQIKAKLKGLSTTGAAYSGDKQLRDELIREIFSRISESIIKMLLQASQKSGLKDVIMSGGVTSSEFIRRTVSDPLAEEDIVVYFDDDENDLATDNAVGIALLGGMCIWDDQP